jgi:transcriptional regulator with XRE-family HTH domain
MGRSSPSVRIVFRLCAALDVSPSDLLRDTERRLALQPHADQGLSAQD